MIKSDNFITDEVRKAAEKEALANLMGEFSECMFRQSVAKLGAEYKGWDKAEQGTMERLKSQLADNVNRGDWIDVANVAMFLWNLHQPDKEQTQ